MELNNRVAFVTGGASGIGLALGRLLGRKGAKVMLADVDEGALRYAEEGLRALSIETGTVTCDVADRGSVKEAALQTLARFGKVHIACNNAGVVVGGSIGSVSERDWDWIIDVNLKGVVYGVETFAPLIKRHGEGGHILNTSSMAAMINPPGMEPYCATKTAVLSMSEGWAAQLKPFGIGVSVLCPGSTTTHIHESWRRKPARYGHHNESQELGDLRARSAKRPASGLSADAIAARAVEGMAAGELYILTHREQRALAKRRHNAIMEAFDRADTSAALRDIPLAEPPDLDALVTTSPVNG